MGERALALFEIPTGEFACYYSQWAAGEARRERLFDAGSVSEGAAILASYQWQYTTIMDYRAVIEQLDYLQTEVVYILSVKGVTVCVPLWFGLADQTPNCGILLAVETPAAFRRLRAEFSRRKQQITEALGTEYLDWRSTWWLLGYLSTRMERPPAPCRSGAQRD